MTPSSSKFCKSRIGHAAPQPCSLDAARTGRRPHEILARATFTAVKGKEYVVKFSGQGKKRGEKPVFEIPVLFPARYIVERLKHLRADAGMKSLLLEIEQEFKSTIRQNVELDKRRNGSLNRVVREYFGGQKNGDVILELRGDDPNRNNKALRAAYAALVTERDCSGGVGAKIIFASRLLGHFQSQNESDRDLNKLGVTVGYLDYVIKKPVPLMPAPKQEPIKQVRAFESSYESILQLQKEWNLPNQQEVVIRLLEPHEKDAALRNELLEARSKNAELEAKITELEAQIAQLQVEETSDMTPQQTTPFDPAAFKDEILTAVAGMLQAQFATQGKNQQHFPQPTVVTQAKPAVQKEEVDWESKSHAELWATKASGTATEKIRRSYQAITAYNDTIATGDNDRLAITNLALRALSGVNGLVVGEWIKAHADEIISHNAKYGMQNSKDPAKVETYYNKRLGSEKIDQILELIGSEFLEGVTPRLQPAFSENPGGL